MHYHLIVSNRCNLQCRYCGGTRDVDPPDLDYPIDDLVRFFEKDSDVVINFYGGEPLLRPDVIRQVMDRVDRARFVIQTNGLLFQDLGPDYIKRFHTILLSLDGGKDITDAHRAPGVYDKVTKAGRYVRECGFQGDLVARMTVSTDADVFRDCMHLAYMGMFDHIHWQLDFEMFWEGGRDTAEVREWVENSYNPGITKLVDQWVVQLFRQLDLGFVPFIVLGRGLLFGRRPGLWCGSGQDFWGITTDGRLTACPVNLEGEELMAGDIYTTDPGDLLNARPVEGPCPACDVYDFCGGRCLLLNRNRENVSREGWDLMCLTVRHLKRELESVMPDIQDLYEKDSFVRQVFEYPEFNNSTEIMP